MNKKTQRTRIKICGICDEVALQSAVDAGADAVGFMFYEKSKRYVTLENATYLANAVPALVDKVAVFVNPNSAQVKQVIHQLKPEFLQFHGDETAAFCEQFEIPYIRAIRMQDDTDLGKIAKQYHHASGLLVDSYSRSAYGGIGETFNWDLLIQQQKNCDLPIILAGGLRPENILDAITKVNPFAVDVSSGVESNGKKDSGKIYEFCMQLMRADIDKLQIKSE